MKKLAFLLGLVTLWPSLSVNAQTLLSNPSLSGSATASSASIDYRYTRHTRSGSGRGGHGTIYYSWNPYTDQQINASFMMVPNGSSGIATAIGTHYAPMYGAAAFGKTSLAGTANAAAFTTTYHVSTTINTPQVAHQRVTAAAKAGSTFYFTLTAYAEVTVTATGSANGALALYGTLDEGVGVILALYGPGKAKTRASLPPGNYWIISSTSDSAVQDTQLNTLLNLGTTNANYRFGVTFSKNAGGD